MLFSNAQTFYTATISNDDPAVISVIMVPIADDYPYAPGGDVYESSAQEVATLEGYQNTGGALYPNDEVYPYSKFDDVDPY